METLENTKQCACWIRWK